MNFVTSLFELWVLVVSIVLVFLGVTKNEKYHIEKSEKLKLFILGLGLLVLYFIVNAPNIYNGFINGFNAGAN